jgi:hypothetical protein
MLATFGVDVLDPRVTLRRVWSLAQRLPPGSWPDQSKPMAWSVEAQLLGGLIDAVTWLTFVTVKAAGGQASKPKPFRRPWDVAPPSSRRTPWGELAAAVAGQGGVVVTDE